MNIVLWILQAALAVHFAPSGIMKLTRPKEALIGSPLVEDYPPNTVQLIGTAESAAALALILQAATGMAPVLTPLAGTGLVL